MMEYSPERNRFSPLADHEHVRELFGRRFPTGGFSSCDFRPHFDGYGHNAWVEIEPLESIEATRELAYTRLVEMVEFLALWSPQFGPCDRVQFTIGFPVAVKPANRQMFKGWVPATRLADVQPPNFAAVGSGFGENNAWFKGLWPKPKDRPIDNFPTSCG